MRMQKIACLCCFLAFAVVLSFSQTYSGIDDQTNLDNGTYGWGSCSDCAGGLNTTNQFSTSLQATPSLDGQSRQFFIYSTLPYTDALWWYKLGPNNSVTQFVFDFWFYVDTSFVQAFEFDTFQFTNGLRYMFGSQCNYHNGVWEVWNESTKQWVKTKLSCGANTFTPNAWHHLVMTYSRDQGNIYYDAIFVDGKRTKLNVRAKPGPLPAGWSNNLGVQFQIDLGANGGQATMWVDKVALSAR